MLKLSRYFIRLMVFLGIAVCMHGVVYAAESPVYSQGLGNSFSIALTDGAEMPHIEIVDYGDAATIQKEYLIRNIFSLEVDEKSNLLIPFNFKVSVKFDIHYITADNVERVLSDKVLVVDYKRNAGEKFNALDQFAFKGAVKMWAVIKKIESFGSDWNIIKSFINLKGKSIAKRDYKFVCSAQIASLAKGSVSTVYDEVPLAWEDAAGVTPTHYDIEWSWIEKNEIDDYGSTEMFFKNNATRVTVNVLQKTYTVPALYDNEGYIFFRVRPVQLKETGEVINGQWSTDGLTITQIKDQVAASSLSGNQPAGNFFIHKGHEAFLNWQVITSFAEEGKRKTVIQYFDGSLRLRQTVTKDNETKKTLVAENFYDYQGRSSIEVLPAPTLDNVIKYVQNFNQFDGTASTYPKDFYDGFVPPATLCAKGSPKLVNTSGASQYYSINNPEAGNTASVSRFVPDANGFPYTETRYTPDNTGRIASKGGVGDIHQLGSGHETKYYYGAPDQKELDALFGREVGDASHYFKNMVRDANGQYTVSYVNMTGKTVATALAGEPPVGLSPIPSLINLPVNNITKSLVDESTNIVKGKTIESSKSLLVPQRATYVFNYSISSRDLLLLNCKYNNNDTYHATYDLEITITNACGDIIYTTTDFNKTSFNISNISLLLEEGEYNISKKLSVNEAAQANYRVNTFLPNNTCKTVEQFATEFYNSAVIQNPDCKPTCASCTANIGSLATFKAKYIAAAGMDAAATVSDALAVAIQKSYNEAVEKCNELCNPAAQFNRLDEMRRSMLEDVTPSSGQYASLENVFSPYSIFYRQITIVPGHGFEEEDPIIEPVNTSFVPYLNPYNQAGSDEGGYLNDAGSKDISVYNGSEITDPFTFSANFNSKWAAQLLPYHPEYCKLNVAETQLKTSYSFDADMEATDSYTQAVTKNFVSDNLLNNDPFFNGAGYGYKNQMSLIMNEYIKVTHDEDVPDLGGWWFTTHTETFTDYQLNMWQAAYASVFCKNVSPGQEDCGTNAPASPSLFPAASSCGADWDYFWRAFRAMYLTKKDSLINVYLSSQCTAINNSTLKAGGFRVHFDNMPLVINESADGSGYSLPTDQPSAQAQINAQYEANCRANTKTWTNILMSCPQISGIADISARNGIINEIIEGFVTVCKGGCTETNPFGASSLPDGSSSFKTVVEAVFANYTLPVNEFCNGYLFDWPKPFDKQPALANATIIDPPKAGSCACERLTLINQEPRNYGQTLSNYLQTRYNTTISQSTLDILLASCAGTYTCNFLSEPISIPPVLQCNVNKSVCITCTEYNTYKSAFNDQFGESSYGGAPFKNFDPEAEPNKLRANEFFAKFMNSKTGFSKEWVDYAAFEGLCPVGPITYSESSVTTFATFYSYTGPTLCGSSSAAFAPIAASPNSPCNDIEKLKVYAGYEQFELTRQTLIDDFDRKYVNKCLEAKADEIFTVTHRVAEYHYTLYYYDQAGNLVKTVAPKGVKTNYTATYLDAVAADRKNNTGLSSLPAHEMATQYRYNTLNQVVAQYTPDGGESHFWYDRLGRLVVTQTAKQKTQNRYSYTIYDELGRVTEVGEKPRGTNSVMTQIISRDKTVLYGWITGGGTSRQEITRTVYDEPYDAFCDPNSTTALANVLCQKNLRNRVSYSMVIDNEAGSPPDITISGWASARFYTYDIHGNVDTLLHSFRQGAMAAHNEFKKVVYRYDLISGKANHVAYQPGQIDAFYHRYFYDGENKLERVETSADSLVWERDAVYKYYRHGPLARAVLGNNGVQGVDYAYTVQGWLKGINSSIASATDPAAYNPYDMGQDGANLSTARDVYGFNLNYYSNDFTAIGTAIRPFAAPLQTYLWQGFDNALYNGNVAAMAVHIPKLGVPKVYAYRYDQLNRLVNMDSYDAINPANNTYHGDPANFGDYAENISYDANGNILTYLRNGTTQGGRPLAMDNLTYTYKPGTNQLDHVNDPVAAGNYAVDIDDQAAGNYQYDETGNLIADAKEGILNIDWTVYGKIKTITKDNDITIIYAYDAVGNRISKTVTHTSNGAFIKETDYVRDANGNVLSVYEKSAATGNSLTQTEVSMYSNRRMGVYNRNINVDAPVDNTTAMTAVDGGKGYHYAFERGNKFYELTNHLGNVMATITDRLLQKSTNTTTVQWFEADIATATDYYPFGMAMPGRNGKAVMGGGWSNGTTKVNGVSVPETIIVNSRTENNPNEYKAGTSIEFTDGFITGNTDEFVAWIADATNTTPGSGGTGSSGNTLSDYRYGFNGKELDGDIGNDDYNYDARIYDARLGRWLSLDPLAAEFANNSPYSYAFNNPVALEDKDGKCPIIPLLMKMAIGGAADYMMQVGMNYFFNSETRGDISKSTSLDHIDKGSVARATLESACFWKVPGGKLGKAAASAVKDVIANFAKAKWEHKEYTTENAVIDFTSGFLSSLAGDALGDMITRFGTCNFAKGLTKLGFSEQKVEALFAKAGVKACFVAGTLVLTNHGYKKIEQVMPGDSVWAFNDTTGSVALQKVISRYNKSATQLIIIKVSKETIITTAEHPFWIGNHWKAAKYINAGDSVTLYNRRKAAVTQVTPKDSIATVYNFEVAHYHTYYVTTSGVLVHNLCDEAKMGVYKVFDAANNVIYAGKGPLERAMASLKAKGNAGAAYVQHILNGKGNSVAGLTYGELALVFEQKTITELEKQGSTLVNKVKQPAKKILASKIGNDANKLAEIEKAFQEFKQKISTQVNK